jgi:hypothetical protein
VQHATFGMLTSCCCCCCSYETQRLLKTLSTRQAVKTVLNYLSETNGELHFFLHNYLSEHLLPLAGGTQQCKHTAQGCKLCHVINSQAPVANYS